MDTLSDLMTPDPVVFPEDAPIAECARTLVQQRYRHLPVVDGEGRLAGLLTDFAVFQRGGVIGAQDELWVPFEPEDALLEARDLLEPARLVASPDDALGPVLARMAADPQDLVVVVDERQHPVGVVSEHDVVRLAQGVLEGDRLVADEATRPVLAVEADAPAQAAWVLVLDHEVRHVAVVDGGRLFGVLSYRDLISEDVGGGRQIACRDVVRNLEVHSVVPDTPLDQAAALMARHKIGCLPVLGPGNVPVAILTRTDLIRAVIATLDEEALFEG